MNVVLLSRKYLWLLKAILAISLFFILYITLKGKIAESDFVVLANLDFWKNHFHFFIFALALMPVNWLLEAAKWRLVMQQNNKIKFSLALRSVLMGTTFAIITPMGIGDFYGRTLLTRSNDKAFSVFATFICGLTQNIVNVSFGLIGLIFYLNVIEVLQIDLKVLVALSMVFITTGLLVLFKHDKVLGLLSRIKYISGMLIGIIDVSIGFRIKLELLCFTALRYLIYLFQYLLLILFLSVELPIFNILIACSTLFLVQSITPLPPFLNLLARAELAILVWTSLGVNYDVAIIATLFLWVINLVTPALVGLMIALGLKHK